jgi:hypothetical protein
VPICAALSLARRLLPPTPLHTRRAHLVVMLSEMGSLVLAQPMFSA